MTFAAAQSLGQVNDILLDIDAMQQRLRSLSQKVRRIHPSVTVNTSLPLETSHCQLQDLESETNCSAKPIDVTTVVLPEALQGRWTTEAKVTKDSLEAAQNPGTKNSSALNFAKPVRWDRRWQDVFDSNEHETSHEDGPFEHACAYVSEAQAVTQARAHAKCMVHPHSRFRVCWDMIGLMAIIYDAFTLPLLIAWDSDLAGRDSDLGKAGAIPLGFGILYWSFDIALSFNTGYFKEATLILSRRDVAAHYLRTWLLADFSLVCLDIVIVASKGIRTSVSMLKFIRLVRLVRLIRGWRLFTMSEIFLAAEHAFNVYGGNAAVIAVSILKTVLAVSFISHLASCAWYYIGRSQPGPSWMDNIENFDDQSQFAQYTRAFYWCLGHLTAAPTDPDVSPQTELERCYTLSLILIALLVIGVAISNMSNTVASLNRSYDEANETKRTLQGYLHEHGFPKSSSVRIVRHALHVHKKKSSLTLDDFTLSLLSSSVVSEINAWQRCKYLEQHPFFTLISNLHPEAILEIYSACVPTIHAYGDVVYKVRTLSEACYVTVSGRYSLHHFPDLSENTVVTNFEKTQFFCEVSLFASLTHRSTLKAVTFADSLSLHSVAFVRCVRHVPSCIGTIYRYANCYLSKLVEVLPLAPEAEHVPLKDGEIVVQDVMPHKLSEEACKNACGSHLPELSETVTPKVEKAIVHDVITCIMAEDLSSEEIVKMLESAIPEVREEDGLYTQIHEHLERKRSIGAMLGLILLSKDSYSSFVECQRSDSHMTLTLWGEWQRFMTWADVNQELMHASLVLLGIRGLGKAKSLMRMVPPRARTPENSVLYLIDSAPQTIPSVTHLSSAMFDLVKKVLETHKEFNLAQLMQGENTPYQVLALKRCIAAQGEVLLRLYLLTLVGMMCGLTGSVTLKGCLFMDENNARNVLSCIDCLRTIESAEPHAVYWSYISRRATWLGLSMKFPEDCALARLACLIRASAPDCVRLREIWSRFDPYDRGILVEHFIADGINERSLLLSFLPVYLLNAKNNRVVGLYRGLLVLIEFIIMLQRDGVINNSDDNMVVVNLSEVASFTNRAVNSLAFESVVVHSNILIVHEEVRITVSAKHWQSSTDERWKPEPMHEISHEVKKITRTTRSLLAKQALTNPRRTFQL